VPFILKAASTLTAGKGDTVSVAISIQKTIIKDKKRFTKQPPNSKT